MTHPAVPRRIGLRRTLIACAGVLCLAFATGGALLAWAGRSAVLEADRTQDTTAIDSVRRRALVMEAHAAGVEVSGVLAHTEATARSLAADASRTLGSLDPAALAAATPTGDEQSLPATEWVPAADRGVYIVRRRGAPEIAALDGCAAALRSAAAPGSGIARVALRLDCGIEVGAPASIAVFAANDEATDRHLRLGVAEEAEIRSAGWSVDGVLAPETTFCVPVMNSSGARIGTIICEADEAAIAAALAAASARLDGSFPAIVTPLGRAIGPTGDTTGIIPEEFASALGSVVGTAVQGRIPADGTSSVGGTISSGVVRLAGTPFSIAVVRPTDAAVPGTGPVAAAAQQVFLGVCGATLLFGFVLIAFAMRVGTVHDENMGHLRVAAEAHRRGDYGHQAPAAGDDDIAELGAWLNTSALRLRHAISRADECDRRLTSLVESMADGFMMTNVDDRITFVNHRFCELVGRPAPHIVGKYVEEFLLPESLERYRTEAARRREKRPSRYEVQWSGARGVHPRTLVSGVPLFDEEGRLAGSYGVVTDITDKVRAQEEFARAEKVRALGEMAGGVAHDFNNMLTVILGNTQFLLLENVSDEVRQTLRTIERAALDGTETVRRIREFSKNRTATASSVPLDPNHLIADVVTTVREKMHEEGRTRDAVYEVEILRRSRRRVRANEAEIREAITHVVQNALESMPKGGKLIVDAFDRGEDAVGIRVEDRGCGMTPEQIQKMYDPFFTTKQGGRCSGLGLSIAYGIVRAHRGQISAKSEPGHGTTVTIVLPAEGSVTISRTAVAGPAQIATEEPRVLCVTKRATEPLSQELRALGLNVTAVNSPSSALGLAADAGIFNTLIVEYELAGTTGWELARQARGVRRNLRILLLTDPDHPVDSTQARNAGIDRVLTRPFDARDVHGEVFSMLVAAPARRTSDVRVPRRAATSPRLPRGAPGEESSNETWSPQSESAHASSTTDNAADPFAEPEQDGSEEGASIDDSPRIRTAACDLATVSVTGDTAPETTPDAASAVPVTEPRPDGPASTHGGETP